MGALTFDDLTAPQSAPQAAPQSGGGPLSFDDLVPSRLDQLKSAVTDIGPKIYDAGAAAVSAIGEAFNPYSATNTARMEAEKAKTSPFDISGSGDALLNTGKGMLAVPSLVASPITGAARSVIGHTYDAASPSFSPADLALLHKSGVTLPTGDQVADTAMMGIAPARGGLPTAFGPAPAAPVAPAGNGPLGVTLSQGQATGELPLIQKEQAALRGQSGAVVQKRAQEFADQQATEVARAKEAIAQSLDPARQIIASNPQEAGQAVSAGVQDAANAAKANVKAAYDTARGLPGEIHAAAFEGLPQQIKGDLTLSPEPVIIDQNTPVAARMIDYLDQKVGQLNIPNKADPFGAPNPQSVVGVSLQGVDQWRKSLSTLRGDALASNNAADQRAARAVMDSFDNRIDKAVNGGLFSGDPRAVKAWNDARAAYSDYRKTFTGNSKDAAGRVVEKIIGKGQNPAAIPNDVADFLYGSSGVNPNSLNVAVANRVKGILGEASPEWSAVRQGLFSRLVEPAPGMTDFGPGKVAQRINKFLNGDGKELASTLFRPHERALVQQYADLMRQIEVPQAGANWSNTATFTSKALKKTGHIGEMLGAAIGAAIGHHSGLPDFMGEAAGAAVGAGAAKMVGRLGDVMAVRAIAKQMPTIRTAVAQYQKAVAAYQKSQAPLSKASLGVAAANLSNAFRPLGITLESLGAGIGAMNAPASNDQK